MDFFPSPQMVSDINFNLQSTVLGGLSQQVYLHITRFAVYEFLIDIIV